MTNTLALDDKPDFPLTSTQPGAFDEPIFDKYHDMDSHDVPNLPPKSALRRSRMLDNHGLKLGGAAEAAELVKATTPHDVYLSSEEDASSEADDFSDYDYDSSVEDPASPTRRASHEDTARVVSVVFAGKPSIVDLPATRKRPASSSSLSTARTRSSTESSVKQPATAAADAARDDRPITPASTTTSSSQHSPLRTSKDTNTTAAPHRKSLLLSEILIKKKPPFLSIDPYANGSTYSLDIPRALDSLEGEVTTPSSTKTPRTPTALLKGVTRSFSLSRRRSRPNLAAAEVSAPPPVPKLDMSALSPAVAVGAPLAVEGQQQNGDEEAQQQQQQQQQQQSQQQTPLRTPMTPITYNDILKAVKRNATVLGAASPPSDILSPTSPNTAAATAGNARRGILSGLAARRRSVKLTRA